MSLKKHFAIMLNGLVVVAPLLITAYVVVAALLGLDRLVRRGLGAVWENPSPGIGIVVGVAGIYLIGLLARSWMFRWAVGLGEKMVGKIPLIKSLYSAVRDLFQFLGGPDKKSRGRPAVVKSEDGRVLLLGIITQESPPKFSPDDAEDRVAVYLPMSYQIGGYTVFVPRRAVEVIEGLSVEEVMKLTLTAGVGAGAAAGAQGGADATEGD